MHCEDCPRWDEANERCQDGKVNPPDYDQAVNVANVIGIRAICVFNDHRERLIMTRTLSVGRLQRRVASNEGRR